MKAIDLKAMKAEMDAEDAELMQFFHKAENKIDDRLLITSVTGQMSIVTKDDWAHSIKQKEDLLNGAAIGAAIGGCLMCAGMMLSGLMPVMDGFFVISAVSIGSGLLGLLKKGGIGNAEH